MKEPSGDTRTVFIVYERDRLKTSESTLKATKPISNIDANIVAVEKTHIHLHFFAFVV